MKNQLVVVVGGLSGIGRAVAEQAAAAGARVVAAGRRVVPADWPPHIQAAQLDLTDDAAVQRFFAEVGAFDHLVVTAGPVIPSSRLVDLAPEQATAAFNVKVFGQLRAVKYAAQYLKDGGSVTLTSGLLARKAVPGGVVKSAMNAAVEIDGKSFANVAQQWLAKDGQAAKAAPRATLLDKILGDDLWTLTRQHLTLVLLSVAVACLIGIPLGVLAAFYAPLRQTVLALVGVLQTVPSLALLAILIPVLGMIGTVPALVALCVYALLPIVRNTCTGILQVPEGLRMAALALGLSKRHRLLHVELPLALPVILAGVKTAAVMSVGTATIAAFIGAGGYGERITIGLALNDNDMLLAGAIPAAVLALLTQGLFELVERWVVADRQR